jgi:uncharacterized protein (TIGR00304 family)
MNKFHILSLICLIAGIVFFALGFLYGDVETGVFFIFPFLSGSGVYAFVGFVFIFMAILLFMFGFATYVVGPDEFQAEHEEYQPRKKTSVKGGGVVLIGPIPIIFGSNWKIAIILTIATIIFIIVAFFAFRII